MSPQGPAPARTVLIYRNGDRFFPGRRFLVTPRRFPTFEAFLDEVTKALHTPLAVRNLYTPRHGHGVTRLGDLRDGGQYVAAGSERLRKLDYLNQGRKEPRGMRKSLQSRAADPWKSNTFIQRQQLSRLPCTIHCGNAGSSHALGCFSCSVFRNGDLLSPPFPLVLPKRIPLEWDTLLATLTEKVELGSGAVNKLCRLDGTPVCRGEELENGHHYVAVGKEEYKPLPYRELLVPQECRTLGWTVAGCRPRELQRKARSHLPSHSCKFQPGNLPSRRKSPFSTSNLCEQDRTEGAAGVCSPVQVKV
ncbi:doublecortin domain-containing protein 2B isoform X4 [Chiroxiphia lanceolata]|uniref:doublecortin domain-containing protein 2B isoform X4 n=1 Tax=Chiroxiphia lanceolata TaxID=296741 RepID=UPI0013CF3AFC|nr:doublecortin domain-containing protein 2B isoform X4 [Chiroxiphia lanceolata]